MHLNDQVFLVTGSSRGIGAGIAVAVARYGANVVVNYARSAEAAQKVKNGVEAMGRRAITVQADVTNGDQVRGMVQRVLDEFGRIDVLVNNAGQNPMHPVMTQTEEEWDQSLALNLKSYFLCSQAVLESMVKRGAGRIINISSISGQRGGLSCDGDYSAAKAGIFGLTRALSRWAAPRGILVNAIAPGYIVTDDFFRNVPEWRQKELKAAIPLKRFGTPEDVGEFVAALAGPAGSYFVGEIFTMNGGIHMA